MRKTLPKPICLLVACCVALGLGLAACGGSSKKDKSAREGDEPSFSPATLMAFKAKGLEYTKFEEVNPAAYGAEACASGQVEGLAVLLCKYADPAKADGAEARLLTFVQGAVTGVVRTRGEMGMVVADPDKMDLRGKNIAKIVKAFTNK